MSVMKIFGSSKKLIWCLDLICRKFFTRTRYKSEEEEGNEGRCFMEELPDEVMQLILQRLPLLDYLNCRDVNRFWRAAIDNKRWLPAVHNCLPLLVTSSRLVSDMLASYIKLDDGDPKFCKLKINRTDYGYRYCAGSIEGWLIIKLTRTYGESFFFWNPVSGAQVKLPSHPRRDILYFPTAKVVASSIPTSTMCYAACLNFEERDQLAFCKPTDKSWTLIKAEKAPKFRDIEILDDGKLYVLGIEAFEFLMVFDIHLDTHAYTSQRLVTLHHNVSSIVDGTTYYRTCYLAKCCESKDLFMILYQEPCFSQNRNNGFEGLFQVLKLKHNDVTVNPHWIEIADLGDQALFISTQNNRFITCHDKTLGIRNCIYSVLPQGLGDGYNSGVFSLTDRSFKPITRPENLSCQLSQSTWFTPNRC